MAKKTVNVGDSDENADWIKAGKGHKQESSVHKLVAQLLKSGKGKKKPKRR